MKKNYLAPKSETLMAVLCEVCNTPDIGGITGDPSETGATSTTPGF